MNQDNNANDTSQNNFENNIEVVDLNTDNTSEIPQKKEKSNIGIILVIFLIVGLFIMFLPYVDSFIKNVDTASYYDGNDDEDSEFNLYNGKIIIGEDSFMTVSDIKYYNFSKKSDNILNFNYISNKSISNVEDLGIYISLYSSSEELIYRSKFSSEKIISNSVDVYKLSLPAEIYSNSKYAKVEVINDNSLTDATETSMECIYDKTVEDINLYYSVKYYFKLDQLTKYEVEKNILYSKEEESEKLLEYKQELTAEYNLISSTNVQNIEKDELVLSYIVDFSTLDLLNSEFSPLYEEGTIKYEIKNKENSLGWECN